MITWTKGNIFDSDADALVCPVNCIGSMGAGLAKQFRDNVPGLNKHYTDLCDNGQIRPGDLEIFEWERRDSDDETCFTGVVLFPTKDDWRKPTKLEWIDQGLEELVVQLGPWDIKSIAIPAIGCGLGGLRWYDVRYLIEKYLGEQDVEVIVFEPSQNGPARRRGRPGRSHGRGRRPRAFKGNKRSSGGFSELPGHHPGPPSGSPEGDKP